MKVLNLQCTHQHGFEGWFSSEDDFQDQQQRGIIECPLCGDTQVAKMLSAPRLNLGAARKDEPAGHAVTMADTARQAALMQAVRHVIANTEDVGERFPEEARRIHYGESEERNIRGQASPHEALALAEEGIGVLALPIPPALKETLQ